MEENINNSTENTEKETITQITNVATDSLEKKKKRFNIELVLASFSLFISLSTFGITAFQTRIMQNQQKAAVWAYLEAEVGISSNGFYCNIHNKGVGAAIVKEVIYTYQNKKYTDFAELAKKVVNDSTFTYQNYTTNPINRKVFGANEKINLFGVKDMKYAVPLVNADISLEIIYTNIYGDVSRYKIP